MQKFILVATKVLLVLLLVSSFYLCSKFIENQVAACFLSMIFGMCIIPAIKLSTETTPLSTWTLKGIGKKTPVPLALVLASFFALIPLSFQPELSKAYNSYVSLIRQSDFSLFNGSQLWDIVILGSQLILGGMAIMVLIFLFQIMSKRVVDHFCD